MFTLTVLIFGLYVGIKFAHLITGAGLGFRRVEATWLTRIRAGEPMLLIGTLTLFALLSVYVTWWTNRFLEAHYSYDSDCYSRMAASHLLPGRPARFGSYGAAERSRWYADSAERHGVELGMRVDEIDGKLAEGRTAYSEDFARLARSRDQRKIAASFESLDRCMKGDGNPRGELLNPV
ncbi:MAG: hypothetical protein QOJ91_1457 [Sphingomonadales bacterium]|nr:hypothetical protein [Sphingomonadales bacterium]